METAIVVMLYAAVVIFDFLPLIKQKDKKEIWIYSVFLSATFCVLLLKSIGFKMPLPFEFIEKTIKKLLAMPT